MPHTPPRHNRRSIRLPGYDYAQAGAYFVTVVTHGRRCRFDDAALRVIAETQWAALARAGERGHAPGRVALDAWVVMPNHVHGIIVIGDGGDDHGGDDHERAQQPRKYVLADSDVAAATLGARPSDAPYNGLGINVAPGSLGAIIRSYKAATTRRINRLQRTRGVPVWQRGYWEKIIRDDRHLTNVRRYIANNPARWQADREQLNALLARLDHYE